jgi:toxin ParE1/3/4
VKRIEIFVRHDAELDAFGYFQFLNELDAEVATRFLKSIDDTVEGLALHPLKRRLRKFKGRDLKNIRFWRIDGFENYLIFYRLNRFRLEILRVKHGAMDFPRAVRQD